MWKCSDAVFDDRSFDGPFTIARIRSRATSVVVGQASCLSFQRTNEIRARNDRQDACRTKEGIASLLEAPYSSYFN